MKGRIGCCLLLALLLVAPALAEGTTRFVVNTKFQIPEDPAGLFESPLTPAVNIQDALDISVSGDTVLVAGIPSASFLSTGGSYDETIHIPIGVVLLGGWDFQMATSGGDTRVFQYDSLWTFIIPPSDSRACSFDYDSTFNAIESLWEYSVPDASTEFGGFIIRSAVTNVNDGAGIMLRYGSPVIRNNVFVNNQTNAARGAAIFVGFGSPLIAHNTFGFCRSSTGSGVVHISGGSPEVRDNIFYNTSLGVGIACVDSADVDTVRYNIFYRNGGRDTLGCLADETNFFEQDPVFCDPVENRYTLFSESPYTDAASDGAAIGAWGIGCRASSKYVSISGGGDVFPYDTPANAALTVEDALAIASAGDSIKIAVGYYEENLSVPPGVTIVGGYNQSFDGNQVNTSLGGAIIAPADPNSPILDIAATGDPVGIQFLILTGATAGDGAVARVTGGTVEFLHTTIAINESGSEGNAIVKASGGSDVTFRYAMFANNSDGPLLGCEGGASISADSSNFSGNTKNVADGCAAVLTNSFEEDPLFCDPDNLDFRIFSESDLDVTVGGVRPIGAVGSGCNFVTHHVWAGGGEGVFPYEVPEKATSDLAKVIGIAEAADTIRIAAGTYEVNVVVEKAITLLGGWTDSTFTGRESTPGLTVLTGTEPGEPTVHFTSQNVSQAPRGALVSCVVTHNEGVPGSGVFIDMTARPFINQNLITGNRIDRSSGSDASGAGLDLRGGPSGVIAPEITHNTIVYNVVENAPEDDRSAGGVFVENASGGGLKIAMSKNIIAYNEGGSGGYVDDARGLESNLTILNIGWQNIDRDGVESNFFSFRSTVVPGRNIEADPDFCDPAVGVFTISNCSPAAEDTFSASGDTVAGALPISPDCQCANTSFLVNATSQSEKYPFSSSRTAARRIASLSPYLASGDSVKVSNSSILFEQVTLVDGVQYLGGYDASTFSNATRLLRTRSRIAGSQVRRIIYGGQGISDSTLLDYFDFSGGVADIGAAVYLEGDASPVIHNCTFLSNTADSTGAVIWAQDEAAPTVSFCQIYENIHRNPDGGLIHLKGGGGTFFNNVISNNQKNGRGFLIENCTPVIYNNAITFNDHGVKSTGGDGTVFDHNNIFHNGVDLELDFTAGEGNISAEAYYCDRFARIYTLRDHSNHLRTGRDGGNIGPLPVNCNTPIHFVGPNGSNRFPYSSRSTAALSIQDAVDAAALAGLATPDSVDEVRVLAGTYNENVVLASNVRLMGGFVGNYSPDGQDPDSNETFIVGLGDGPVVTIDSGVVDRPPGGRYDEVTTLEGFRISEGDAERGGGVHIGRDGSPVVRQNIILNNSAEKGGGIYSAHGATPSVVDNIFLYNVAGQGAGLYADTVAAPTTALYEKNTFFGNEAGSDSAGIIHTDGALIWFQENLVTFSRVGRAYSTGNEEPANINRNLFFGNPGGDSLDPGETSVAEGDIFQIVANPVFCDTAVGNFGVFYSLSAIQDSVSALQDSCAETWWGAKGAGCTRPGHRFLVRQEQSSVGEVPIFPHACKENAALTLDEVINRVNAGDTVEVARSNNRDNQEIPHRANMYLNRPIVLRGGWNVDFSVRNADLVGTRTIVEPLVDGPLLRIEQDPAAATDSTLVIDSMTIIEGLIFRGATAQLENGGAIQVRGGASPTIRNNQMLNNKTDNWGGGISIRDAISPRIYNNYINNNDAGIGGGIYIFRTVDPVVRGNIIARNKATDFGGIRLEEVTGGSVDNNVFYRNAGGGVSFSEPGQGADLVIANNAITSNGGHGLSLFPSFSGVRKAKISHNDIWANGAGSYLNLTPGTGDISVSPQYCNTERRDNGVTGLLRTDFFRYQECSPLVDSGRDPDSDLDAIIGVARASDPVCTDTTAPTLAIGFLLHSAVGGVANLLVVPSEAIDRDSISLWLSYGDRVDPEDIADSLGAIEDSVVFETHEVPLRLIEGNPISYTSDNLVLRSSDSLVVTSRAVDLCGQIGSWARLFSSQRFKRGQSGALRSADKRVVLDVPGHAFSRNGVALMEVVGESEIKIADEGSQAVSLPYHLNMDQIKVVHPVLLSVDVGGRPADRAELKNMAVFRLEEEEWVHQPSTIDPALNLVYAPIEKSGIYEVRYSGEVASSELVPARFALYPNMPNPFNPTTRILFDLPAQSLVDLEIYDVRGRLVRTLHQGSLPAGRHVYTWDGTDHRDRGVGSGVYFYRLDAGSNTKTRKMILIR